MNKIKSDKYVSRYYIISLNFGLVFYQYHSRTFILRKGVLPYLLGFQYVLMNLLTGFWEFFGILRKFQGLRNTLNAIHINLTGGEDATKLDREMVYDDYTVYIYNNLGRDSSYKMSLEEVNIILEIQELFSEMNTKLFTEDNVKFILDNLSKVNLSHLKERQIESVFNAIEIHNKYNKNNNIGESD